MIRWRDSITVSMQGNLPTGNYSVTVTRPNCLSPPCYRVTSPPFIIASKAPISSLSFIHPLNSKFLSIQQDREWYLFPSILAMLALLLSLIGGYYLRSPSQLSKSSSHLYKPTLGNFVFASHTLSHYRKERSKCHPDCSLGVRPRSSGSPLGGSRSDLPHQFGRP